MNSLKEYLFSSIGMKQLVAVSGLGLSGFVLTHMAGNMLLLVSAESYNRYGHALISNPFLPLAEMGLVVLLLVHVFFAVKVTAQNRSARPIAPAKSPNSGGKWARFGSRSMILTGLLVLAFLVLHLITFKYGAHYVITYGDVEMRDLYKLIVEKFSEPLYVGWYLFSLVILWVHLSHGFAATFQSLGFASVRNSTLKKVGYAFALVVAVGFISQPLFIFFGGGN